MATIKNKIETSEDMNTWAADNYGTEENCNGTPKETLMAGWVNATDSWGLKGFNEETFIEYFYANFLNYSYEETHDGAGNEIK